MKATSFILIVWVLCASTAQLRSDAPKPFVIQAPNPTEGLSIDDFTPEQIELCAQFRRLDGQYRKRVFDAIYASDCLPFDRKRITEDQVLQLLGSPSSRSDDTLSYALGQGDGGLHSLRLTFMDGRVAFILLSKTT